MDLKVNFGEQMLVALFAGWAERQRGTPQPGQQQQQQQGGGPGAGPGSGGAGQGDAVAEGATGGESGAMTDADGGKAQGG